MSFQTFEYGDPMAEIILVQMVDDHDLEMIEKEAAFIRELSPGRNFCFKVIKVNDWNKDLAPWEAPAVFGNEDFGSGAGKTLDFILQEIVPEESGKAPVPQRRRYLGGYSLAGLFALWAGYQTNRFDGIAAASPSAWFPGFTDYMRENQIITKAVYFSLGDKEEKTRNPVMAQVGNAIRDQYQIINEAGIPSVLEWNKGNHFKEPDLRTAKAFAWLMDRPENSEGEK